MADIVMPRLSDTMEEGTVLRWLKRDGEHVRRGEELVEIETDKASMTYESDQEGVLELVAGEGDTLAIGAVIAHVSSAATELASTAPDRPTATTPSASGSIPAPAADGHAGEPTAPPAAQAPAAASTTPASARDSERVKASPLAKRVAHETGIALEGLAGSGPGGRIVKADVEAAQRDRGAASAEPPRPRTAAAASPAPAAAQAPPAPPAPSPADVMTAKGAATTRELTRTQQLIARRMAEAKATIPHFTLEAEIDMEDCVRLRAALKKTAPSVVPTYNDMVVKASALALREHPRVNASYRDGRMELHPRVNVGVAVAVKPDDPLASALVVPTVFDADIKSLGEIARETRRLAERVRAATVTPPELSGGTFSVSNLGMYGVRSFTAIINPPQAAILSAGVLEPRALVREGAIVARNAMVIALACDHRILYGADAARFLARVRELLERPAALAL